MIEPLAGMPAGTIGFNFAGRVTGADYRDVLVPALAAAVGAGSVRAVFVVGPDYEGFDLGAVTEDLKALVPLAIEHRHAWKRLAAVSDVEWIAKGVQMFTWLMPGEVRVFALADLEQAKAWVSADGSA